MTKAYIPTATRALSGGRTGFVGLVLCGDEGSIFPPNVMHKRLSQKAYSTKTEAVIAAQDYIRVNRLRTWSRP